MGRFFFLSVSALSLALGHGEVRAEAEAVDELPASGTIGTSFDRIAAGGIAVTINGETADVDKDGQFATNVQLAPAYQVRFEGEGIHTSIQTFGITELYQEACDCLKIPTIDVVARKPGRVELLFVGDAMAGRRFIEPIWNEPRLVDPADPLPDLQALLEPMRPYIEEADMASANLEIVLSERDFGNSPPKTVVFYAPPELADALAKAGFDHVSLGNNHSYDYLEPGLVTTIDAVEKAGLAWSGAGLNEEQALAAARVDVGDQPLSLLGYVGWKGRVEPNQVAEPEKGGAAYGSDDNIAHSVSREAAEDRIVIAQYHGSREYSDNPTEDSERRMKLAIDKGAELVASHHPHVAQGLELYNGGLIAYSTGNFLFDQYFIETHGSFVLKTWIEDGEVIRGEIVPIRVLDYRPVPAIGSMRGAVLDRITRLSAQRGTTVSVNGGHGVIVPETSARDVEGEQVAASKIDILRGGDFENAVYGAATDRSLKATGARLSYDFAGRFGHILSLTPEADGQEVTLAPSTFFRVVPSDRITVSARIRTSRDLVVAVANQDRPRRGMTRFEALEDAPIVTQDSTEIAGNGEWQVVTFSYELDETSEWRRFRPILQFSGAVTGSKIEIDDLKVEVGKEPS